MRWEYTDLMVAESDYIAMLNRMGAKRWEVITVWDVPLTGSADEDRMYLFLLKRPIVEERG